MREENTAYQMAHRKGWWDEISAHMKEAKKTADGTYTKEYCASLVEGYSALRDFRRDHGGAYDAILNKGWLQELTGHLERGAEKKPTVWPDERIQKYADRCTAKWEFKENYPQAYWAAVRVKRLDYLCRKLSNRRKDALPEHELLERFKQVHDFGYSYDFTNYKSTRSKIKITCAKHGEWEQRIDAHLDGRGCVYCTGTKAWKPDLKKLADGYTDLAQFRLEQRNAYSLIVRNGWIDELCSHMDRNRRDNLSKEECISIAADCKTVSEFKEKDASAYTKARTNGWMRDVGGHFVSPHVSRGYWQKKERLVDLASPFDQISKFKDEYPSAYSVAMKNGWKEDVMGHMERGTGFDPSKPAMLYYFRIEDEDFGIFYKIGITARSIDERYNTLFEQDKIKELLLEKWYEIGQNALDREKLIKKTFDEYLWKGPRILRTGNTEIFTADILQLDEASLARHVTVWRTTNTRAG